VRDQATSNQIGALARRLDVLGDRLPAHPDHRTQALISELTLVMERLQRHVDELPQAARDRAPGDVRAGFGATCAPTTPGSDGAHGVHFSRSHEHTVAAIVDMVDAALGQGRSTVVVATGLHRRWIEADLNQRCIAFEGDTCRLLDADTTLSSLLVDGAPDRERFRSVIGALLTDVCARNPGGVSVYGEMVGLLWSRGDAVAAMQLEELWNELRRELPFSLLCGYTIDGSPDSADLDPIRHAHTYVG
jgi:hypothetical protein